MIYHITTQTAWQTAAPTGTYSAPSLQSEGFIHCSHAHQVIGTANLLFQGQPDLIVLAIDPQRLQARLIDEDLYGHGSFPHLYGVLEVAAVTHIIPLPCNEDGTFDPPAALTQQ